MPGVFNVAIEAAIIKDGKILITKRSFERKHAPGEWEILTGRVEQNESFEDALHREVMEEVQLKVKVIAPVNTFYFYRAPDNDEHLGVSFVCGYLLGEVVLDESEQIDFKWATLDEARKLIIDKSILSSIDKVKSYL